MATAITLRMLLILTGGYLRRPAYSASNVKWTPGSIHSRLTVLGFEVRTYRLCQRVLMFHHFPDENLGTPDCLVRSTDFTYSYEE